MFHIPHEPGGSAHNTFLLKQWHTPHCLPVPWPHLILWLKQTWMPVHLLLTKVGTQCGRHCLFWSQAPGCSVRVWFAVAMLPGFWWVQNKESSSFLALLCMRLCSDCLRQWPILILLSTTLFFLHVFAAWFPVWVKCHVKSSSDYRGQKPGDTDLFFSPLHTCPWACLIHQLFFAPFYLSIFICICLYIFHMRSMICISWQTLALTLARLKGHFIPGVACYRHPYANTETLS